MLSPGWTTTRPIFKKILDDPEFRHVLMDLYASRVYRRARSDAEDGRTG